MISLDINKIRSVDMDINKIREYLNDSESITILSDLRNDLWTKYQENLDGDIRIRYNHLDALLNNWCNMDDSTIVKFFNIVF